MMTGESEFQKQSELLRSDVLKKVKDYYQHISSAEKFIPGETYIPAAKKTLDQDDLYQLIHSSLDMWLTAGRFAQQFEKAFSTRLGSKLSSLLVNSGSSANLLAFSGLCSPLLEKLGWQPLKPGDEVITVAAGFPTTVNPIMQNGCVPVFVDIESDTLNANFEFLKAAKSPKTRAVMLAHTLGNPFRADLLKAWCDSEGLFLIEDCCDALGATISDSPVGSFGLAATCSFYPAHHITMGEGGAVVTQNAGYRRVLESLRDWGRDCWCDTGQDNTCKKRFGWSIGQLPEGYDHKYIYTQIGYNLKVTDMQASIGVSQLAKLDSFVLQRRENWKILHQGIKNSPTLNSKFRCIVPTANSNPSWFGFGLICQENLQRKPLLEYLEQKRIGTRLLFGGNLTKQPLYRPEQYRIASPLAETDLIMNKMFWIGVHPSLGSRELNYVLENLEGYCQQL